MCRPSGGTPPPGGGTSVLRGAGGKCLDGYDNRTANGTAVEVWDCNGGDNQKWRTS
ncbi:RICIN domain-containing protein [Micromonospora sp. NPDC049645]|uniref:RICIN domain-containing protein n=1 Tax=Micromonospora sp. NPDC049645 TaxID=3155508 RepID=UPI00341ACD81